MRAVFIFNGLPTALGFRSANPAVDVQFPASVGEPATLTDSGVGFNPVTNSSAEADQHQGELFYPDADGPDTDYILKPEATGAEAFWQLRSAASPEELRLDFTLPAGASLGTADSAGAIPITAADGTPLAKIESPSAVDAQGTAVPLDVRVDGSQLVIGIAHRERDVAYPILVDPSVAEYWTSTSGFNNCGADGGAHSSGAGAWTYSQDLAGGSTGFWAMCDMRSLGWGWGLYTRQVDNYYYNAWANGRWTWQAPPDSYISGILWDKLNTNPGSGGTGNTVASVGIFQPGYWWITYNEIPYQTHQQLWQAVPANNHGAASQAWVGLAMPSSGVRSGAFVGTEGATIYLNDDYNPTVSLRAHTPAPVAPSLNEMPWADPAKTPLSYKLNLADRGLGVWQDSVVRNDNGAAVSGPVTIPCLGTHAAPCPLSYVTADQGYWSSALPEGIVPVHAVVKDINERSAPSPTWNLRIDRQTPENRISGSLWDANNTTIGNGPLSVSVTARDDSTTTHPSPADQSGIARAYVTVDADGPDDHIKLDSGALPCGLAGNCSYTYTYTVDPQALGWSPGKHAIQLYTLDQVGHRSNNRIDVNYYPTSVQYGGSDRSVNTLPETQSVVDDIQSRSISGGDDEFFALTEADRAYLRDAELSTDPQQICREGFWDSRDDYFDFCRHSELSLDDDDTTAEAAGGPSALDLYYKLNDEEKAFCRGHYWQCRRFVRDAHTAQNYAKKLFTGPGTEDNTMANAFKHTYWNVLMTRSVGGSSLLGYEYAKAHEGSHYDLPSNSKRRRASRMDMINNRVGYFYANQNQGVSQSRACKDIYYRASSADYLGVDPDPWAQYEADGYGDLSTWGPIYTAVYRRHTTPASSGSVWVEADSPGGAACDQ
jgi:hypothetical protein